MLWLYKVQALLQGSNAIKEAVEAGNSEIVQMLRNHASYSYNLEEGMQVLLTPIFIIHLSSLVCSVLGHLVSALFTALPKSVSA